MSSDTRVLPLRQDWRQFAYTDGSFIPVDNRPEGAPGIGSACYIPGSGGADDASIVIDPREGSENTIYRADQMVAMQTGAAHIATDSAGVILLVRRAVFAPGVQLRCG